MELKWNTGFEGEAGKFPMSHSLYFSSQSLSIFMFEKEVEKHMWRVVESYSNVEIC